MTDLAGRRPILCLDFDGVCHSCTSGWNGAGVIPDPPVVGMWDFIIEASEHFEVNIYSSRSTQSGGMAAMKFWFAHWYLNDIARKVRFDVDIDDALVSINVMLRFPLEKPPAHVTIDDRAITFTGKWPSIDELKSFQPWNKRDAYGVLTGSNCPRRQVEESEWVPVSNSQIADGLLIEIKLKDGSQLRGVQLHPDRNYLWSNGIGMEGVVQNLKGEAMEDIVIHRSYVTHWRPQRVKT